MKEANDLQEIVGADAIHEETFDIVLYQIAEIRRNYIELANFVVKLTQHFNQYAFDQLAIPQNLQENIENGNS